MISSRASLGGRTLDCGNVANGSSARCSIFSVRDVELHDGSHLRIRKLNRDYDPTGRLSAVRENRIKLYERDG
jgi:hypothetical protein